MNMRIAVPIIIGVVAVSILAGLGMWQLARLDWKQGLLDEIQSRFSAPAVALPADPREADHQFLQVTFEGRLLEGELAVLTSRRPYGPGFKIVSPFELGDGQRILIDRGFVPEKLRDPASRQADAATGPQIGTLFWPNETDSFTPDPDIAAGTWFARDPAAMADVLGTEPVLVSLNTPLTGDWPKPAPVAFNIPNNHFSYALTWFALGIVWLVMTVIWIRTELRKPRRAG